MIARCNDDVTAGGEGEDGDAGEGGRPEIQTAVGFAVVEGDALQLACFLPVEEFGHALLITLLGYLSRHKFL